MFGPWEKIRKDICPSFLQPFLENIDRRSRNGGSRQIIPLLHNPHRKGRPSPSAVCRTLEYLIGVSFTASSNGRKKNQVRIHIQALRENLECSSQVGPMSSPLQGMKVPALQSLFVGEVTNTRYQPCSFFLTSFLITDICQEVWRTGWSIIFEV